MTLRAIGAAVACCRRRHVSAITATAIRGSSSRREGHEQSMVQQMSGQALGVIALVLTHGENLGGAGLAGDAVLGADSDFVGGAAFDHMNHAGDHRIPELRILDRHWRQRPRDSAGS
jgi:hypothetical protein